jgi:hypothetical protein
MPPPNHAPLNTPADTPVILSKDAEGNGFSPPADAEVATIGPRPQRRHRRRAEMTEYDVRARRSGSGALTSMQPIIDAIRFGDLDNARALFHRERITRTMSDLVMGLAEIPEPEPGVITLGEGPMVFGNPFREGFAWRCGHCLHACRNGGPDPKSGVNYKTLRGAFNAARKHSTEDHDGSVPVEEVTR